MTSRAELREQKHVLRSAERDLVRDRATIERQEKQLEEEIRKYAKQGNKQIVTRLAKQLVQLRSAKARSMSAQSHIVGASAQMSAMHASAKVATTMQTAGKVMKSANAAIDLPGLQATMQQFQNESTKMQMSEEMIDDAFDSIADSDEEQESNQVLQDVLDEIGFSAATKMQVAPSTKLPSAAQPIATQSDDTDALLKRLGALKS
eukprot:m.52952 g.52952  ORF g.52952 m.52952 type:complete len:205 (+) comp13115_c0_seq2:39-653(+)